ncbi:MAG: hypothetical protein GY853_13775 [PVC group bacterium]|nr:hypothetical protein [PVC group bacterium]
MAIRDFPLWKQCLKSLASHVDELYLRFDMRTGDKNILPEIESCCDGKLKKLIKSDIVWDNHNWKEELLRILDSVHPRVVLFPDEDEEFDSGIEKDIKNFMDSDCKEMIFDFKTILPKGITKAPSEDGRVYPFTKHVKVFKWRPGLTYIPYKNRGRLFTYLDNPQYEAKSKITHYHFYTMELYNKWKDRLRNRFKLEENKRLCNGRKTIVYILGSTRSGSTMLDLMISSNSECTSLGELCLLHKRDCGFCGAKCKYWKEYKKKFNGNYYETAFKVFKKDILVDSSKKWKWLKERADSESYEYKVIHLVRNGLDRLKFRKGKNGHIKPYVVQAWVNTHRKCEKVRKRYGGILVKYEEINQETNRIYEYLGVKWQDRKVKFWEHEHHGLLGSKTAYSLVKKWHNKENGWYNIYADEHGFNLNPRTGHEFLSKEDIKVFNKYGGRELNKELGYE